MNLLNFCESETYKSNPVSIFDELVDGRTFRKLPMGTFVVEIEQNMILKQPLLV